MENYSIHKKRSKQLSFDKKEDASIEDIIDSVTKPIIQHVFTRIKPRKLEELEMALRMAKWDKYFTPIQYRALNLLLKVLGIVLFLLFSQFSIVIAVIWGVILCFGMDILFKNSITNRRQKLFNDFPDLIRIIEGYLTSGMPFVQSVEESIKYVGDEWKPILKNFVIECEMKSVDEALTFLKEEVDLFEMKEFVSIVKLNLDQGGDAKDSFSAQAEKIRELQMDLIQIKIGQRQIWATMLQAPLLIACFIVLGLPTVSNMMNFTSM